MFFYLEGLGEDEIECALVVAYCSNSLQKRGEGREQRRTAAHINPAHTHQPIRLGVANKKDKVSKKERSRSALPSSSWTKIRGESTKWVPSNFFLSMPDSQSSI